MPRPSGFADFYAEQFDHRVHWVRKRFDVGYQDAEDIVQDAMLELAPKWGTDRAENPEGLLTRIIQRKVYKRWGRAAASPAEAPLEEAVYRLQASATDPAVTAEQRDTIRRAADVMSPIERRIVLGRVNQYSATKIALQAGVSASDVRRAGHQMEQRMVTAEDGPADTLDLAKYIVYLPRRQQEVITLAFRGYRPVAIAGHLGITPNDARVNLCHAKKSLMGLLPPGADPVRRVDLLLREVRHRRDLGLMPHDVKRVVPNRPRYPRSGCQICEEAGTPHR